MEVFMTGISHLASEDTVTLKLAEVLHSPPFVQYSQGGIMLNFKVFLFLEKNPKQANRHNGTGVVTLPMTAVAERFLREFGGHVPKKSITIGGRKMRFRRSNRAPRTNIVEYCRQMPYQDPAVKAAKEQQLAGLVHRVRVSAVQSGWYCRDGVFSLEWMRTYAHLCELSFDHDNRQVRIRGVRKPDQPSSLSSASPGASRSSSDIETPIIQIFAMKYPHIKSIITSDSGEPAIFFELSVPPSFETEIGPLDDPTLFAQSRRRREKPLRRRLAHFGGDHAMIAPFVSLAMRVVCRSSGDLSRFVDMARLAGLRTAEYDYPIVRRALFSEHMLGELQDWLGRLPWLVAFSVEILHKKLLLDTHEILSLRPLVDTLIKAKGRKYVAQLMRHFEATARQLDGDTIYDQNVETAAQALRRIARSYDPKEPTWILQNPDGMFDCLHVTITPSSVIPIGQFADRSNRVIRSYPDHQEYFIRVRFSDEDYLPMRFDREVNGAEFTDTRFGKFMRRGLGICGRSFEMLAYSQSGLKEHSVWFVRPFEYQGQHVTAASIRTSLGSFNAVIHCPSLYGARMSQAFTATDPSVTIEPEEMMTIPDIENLDSNGRLWQFTDGVGTISSELADDICRALRARRKCGKYSNPRAFQIRFAGSKGMTSVDTRIQGRVLCLRPSMIKFEAPRSLEIEIAQTFDSPGKFQLNRPLIMILESLGVSMSVFKKLQDAAVAEANAAGESLDRAARLLETHGLGTAFRLTSLFLGLQKLGVDLSSSPSFGYWQDAFPRRIISYGINHVVRDLKHHARIPVPDSWTLVGIADIHSVLEAYEVFACIIPAGDTKRTYIEGPVMITRSPAIAAGDVQLLKAIGAPPSGSPYAWDPIPNTLVFSTKGKRPIPSYLGGGDLDGDVFNISQYKDLFPKTIYPPASYTTAPRKMLDRPSNINDVIDHVVNFVNNDNVGVIATNFLVIADQSPKGIFQEECIKLSQLHSDAVDFQKSGQPVPMSEIPRRLISAKPDWNAPETITPDADYYKSTKAIGFLFRAIDLPAVEDAQDHARTQRRVARKAPQQALPNMMNHLDLESVTTIEDTLTIALGARVGDFLDVHDVDDQNIIIAIKQTFEGYREGLQYICAMNTLSQSRRGIPLTEEEVVVGTIVAKTPVQRRRWEAMARMREQSTLLVNTVRTDLEGDDETPFKEWLKRAWLAWIFSVTMAEAGEETFGRRSFGWIALGSTLDCLRSWKESLRWDGSQQSHG